jgi:hypothetical protein
MVRRGRERIRKQFVHVRTVERHVGRDPAHGDVEGLPLRDECLDRRDIAGDHRGLWAGRDRRAQVRPASKPLDRLIEGHGCHRHGASARHTAQQECAAARYPGGIRHVQGTGRDRRREFAERMSDDGVWAHPVVPPDLRQGHLDRERHTLDACDLIEAAPGQHLPGCEADFLVEDRS